MKIRWRIGVFFIQVLILLGFTYLTTGKLISGATWFAAGLFSVVINPQLLEPFYSRPADVIGNCFISLLLYLTTSKGIASIGWDYFAYLIVALIFIALIALLIGAGNRDGKHYSIGKVATMISMQATSIRIYSIVFWLSLVDSFYISSKNFWLLGVCWFLITFIGLVNWQRIWGEFTKKTREVVIEGMIGPNKLLISSNTIPQPGTRINIRGNSIEIFGTVVSRINRVDNIWGEILIPSRDICEKILSERRVKIKEVEESDEKYIGCVEDGSTDAVILFNPTKKLKFGDVISIPTENQEVLYQVNSASISSQKVKDGENLRVLASASQVGVFDSETKSIRSFDWVQDPGSPIKVYRDTEQVKIPVDGNVEMVIGSLSGCSIPIFINFDRLLEGHLAILGMTKMGKTTLAYRLAKRLSKKYWVTVLDQTGEYRSKLNIPQQHASRSRTSPGLAVYEPPVGSIAPNKALEWIDAAVEVAKVEYQNNNLAQRIFLIDEAHQFIPEPAVIGYGGAGRESSLKIGSLMMQIRKYKISMMLISQRTAVIAKSALSQCENIIVFKSVDQTGLNYLESIVGKNVKDLIPRLHQGQALCFGPAFSSDLPVIINIPYGET